MKISSDLESKFEEFINNVNKWFEETPTEIMDAPTNAQFALNLIFEALMNNKGQYPYVTALPESAEQANTPLLDAILRKYSKEYRAFLKKKGIK